MNFRIDFGRIGLVPNMHISADSIIEYPKLEEQMDRVVLTLMNYSYISFFRHWNEFFNHNLIVEKRNEWNMKNLSRMWRRKC